MSALIPFPGAPNTEENVTHETDRKTRLYEWRDRLLAQLGLAKKVEDANSVEELRKITFDADAAEVVLAIRDALHPVSGPKADISVGLNKDSLKQLLKSRFRHLKQYREMKLRDLLQRGAAGGSRSTSTFNWTDDLKVDDEGGVRPLLSNLILFLRYHEKWKGVLAYDEFKACVVIRKGPSLADWPDEPPDAPWTDHHDSLVRVWFQREDIAANQGDVARAVQAAARHNPFHPVRDYFNALKWDGTRRLDAWLSTYFHADHTEYTQAIGPRFLISAVARIYKPGCKVDHMLVLEGLQGKQKSEALRTLAIKDNWFTDRLSQVASKDAALELAGVFLVEIAEMDVLMRASSSASKGYLTRRHDRFRPPYGRHPISLPRQCVFAGTINPVVGGYLKDPTGARRIWPVSCHGMIDRDGIERDRDQLWAEAIVRFKAGAPWWLETPELEALATVEQKARFKTDVWKELIEEWLGERKDVSIAEVLQRALGIPPKEQSHSAEIRVARILTDLGFTQCRPRSNKRRRRYRREDAAIAEDDTAGETVKVKRRLKHVSLFQFLARAGGLKPCPDLQYIFDGPVFVPGFGALLRPSGMSLDRARETAVEGRYLADPGFDDCCEATSTINDLLELLRAEAHGAKQYAWGDWPAETEALCIDGWPAAEEISEAEALDGSRGSRK